MGLSFWFAPEVIFEARWRRQLHQHGGSSATGGWAAGRDLIVVHERSTRLVGVDPRDGTTVWDVPFGTWPRAVVVSGDWCVGIAQNIAQLVCFDLSSGQRVWSADLPGFTGHLVCAGGVVLAGGWRGYTPLMAFDLRDGAPLWHSPRPVTTVAPVAVGEQVLLADPTTGDLRLIDPRDGNPVNAWPVPEPLVGDDSRTAFATLDAGRLLIAGASGAQWQIDPATSGARRFSTAGAGLPRAALVVGGLVWLPAADGLVAVDPDTGGVRHRVRLDNRLVGLVETDFGFVAAHRTGVLTGIDHEGKIRGRLVIDRQTAGLYQHETAGTLLFGKGTLSAGTLHG
ncbi:PQQ-binding-like beta-propeller repeat protein [Antribacter gilvus]|uniref:PQQ-binding-like beta-propeller repeat protein n=1 Tax=Antribacter gilvus TaxID=2304675 RepID=UPI0013DF96EC|nr:PQQ-binding-like beta-propeller repeat protein [Antribacter gilvus]